MGSTRPPRRIGWPVRALSALLAEDRVVAWIVLASVVVQLAAAGWDLPGDHSWENDGVAPRDLFGGLASNLTPGHGHRYPLLHYLILGVLSLPVLAVAALGVESWTMDGLMAAVLTVPVMTALSVVAKLVSVAMGGLTVLVLARMARRTLSPSAGRFAALFATTCLTVAYYGRVTNLDGPYVMWTVLAMDRLLTVLESGRRRDSVLFAVLAGAAVGTKDQAYAGFVLPGLLYLVALPLARPGPSGSRAAHLGKVGLAALAGALSLGLLGGGLLNPTGFLVRLGQLTGSSSQDWTQYSSDLAGLGANLRDLARSQEPFFWPWPMVGLAWLGVPLALLSPRGEGLRRALPRLLPLVAALSSLVFFTLVVHRSGHRFALPLGLWLSFYGGAASAWLLERLEARGQLARRAGLALLAALVAWGAAHSGALMLTQWGDARREVVRALAELPEGSVVETYGPLVHQPHFDVSPSSPYRVRRVGGDAPSARNPIVGAEEVRAPYGEVSERRPDAILIAEYQARELVPAAVEPGRHVPAVWQAQREDEDATRFFSAAVTGHLEGYELRLLAEPSLPGWARALSAEPVRVHASTGGRYWLLSRAR